MVTAIRAGRSTPSCSSTVARRRRAVQQTRTSTSRRSRPRPTARSGCAATRASSPNKRVRQALAYTFDREQMIQHAVQGQGRDRQRPRHRPDLPVLRRRSVPQRTQRHREGQALLPTPASRRSRRRCTSATCRRSRSWPQLIQSGAKEAGFDLELAGESLDTFYGAQWCPAEPADPPCSGAAELGIVDYGHRATPDVYLNAALTTKGIWNSSQYSSPEFDAAFKEYQAAIGVEAQKAACKKIETILNEDVPVGAAVLLQLPRPASSKKFQGVRVSALGQMFLDKASQGLTRRRASGARRAPPPRSDLTRVEEERRRPMTRYVVRRLAAVARHVVAARHDRLRHRQRLPNDVGRRIAGPFAPAGDRRRGSTSGSGTNDPLPVQYVRLLRNMVTFDFGDSFQSEQARACRCILAAFGRSAKLAGLRADPDDPVSIIGRHLRRPTAGPPGRPRGRARSGSRSRRSRSSSSGVSSSSWSACSWAGSRCWPRRPPAPASSRSSATSCCRRWRWRSCTSATSPA